MTDTTPVSLHALRRGPTGADLPVGGCGAAAGPGEWPAEVWDKVRDHPCYSESAHHHFARLHVAVAPACNIQCNYCNRKFDCSNESRPGVVSERLTPEQAVAKTLAVARAIPQLTVLGVAGPGDALANPKKTFETFRLLRQQAPGLKLCLSTNGLALPGLVDALCSHGVDHVTITINMVDPEVGARIYPWIFWDHRRITGVPASRILHEQQMKGLERLSARGVLVKVNSVLIPGINDSHLAEVHREVTRRGAFLHNIMPLISAPEHGTAFGLAGRRGPTAQELQAVQDACAGGARVMRHCRQCRADAVGLLGEDRGGEFTLERIARLAPRGDADERQAARQRAQAALAAHEAARRAALDAARAAAAAVAGPAPTVRVAVATTGGGRVNQHFGHAREFQVYAVDTAGVTFVGHRRVDLYCQGGWGEDEALPAIVQALADCHAVLVTRIGGCPREALRAAGIEAVDDAAHDHIESAALAWYAGYRERLASGATAHRPRGDAAIRPVSPSAAN